MTAEPTRRRPLVQLVFCQGCCCGRTDRGRPELPVDRLKAVWRAEKLNRSVQLTISGCLGPCDRTNVTQVVGPAGTLWLGRLSGPAAYDGLIAWAQACHAAGRAVPLPDWCAGHRFDAFRAPEDDP